MQLEYDWLSVMTTVSGVIQARQAMHTIIDVLDTDTA